MNFIKKALKQDAEFIYFMLLITGIVYATSWGGEFLSDDINGIQNNQGLAEFGRQLKTIHTAQISFSLIYNVFGPKPFWYHVLNTIYHLITIIVVYLLTATLIVRNKTVSAPYKLWLPRMVSLLFALHPIETEGIAWISAFPYTALTLFNSAALLLFILVEKRKLNHKWILLSAFAYFLALRSAFMAITLPGILVIYMILWSKIRWKKIKLLIPIILVSLIQGLFLFSEFTKRTEDVNPIYSGGIRFFNPLIQIPVAVFSYTKLLLFPYGLTLYHEFLKFPVPKLIFAGAVTVAYIIVVIFLWIKGRSIYAKIIAFGLSLFLISLTPTLLPINIAWVVAERYVHFGSIGFFLAFSALTALVINHVHELFNIDAEKIWRGLAFFLIILFVPLVIQRNLQWRSQDTLWPATVKVSPYSAFAWNNMGDYYGRRGDIENSIRAFENARRIRPRYADATHNLGNTYMAIGEATKAAELFKEALEYNPTIYQSYINLGKISIFLKDYENAEKYLLTAIKLNPNAFEEYLYLYMAYTQSGKNKKAEEALLTAHKLAGNNPQLNQRIQQIQLATPEQLRKI